MNALSSALAQALVALAEDPLLVWNYGLVAVLAAVGGVLFWIDNRKLDREEDKLNLLPSAQFHAKMKVPSDEESGNRVVEEVGSEKRSSE
jgi:POT family proton-dependent oligopeptide transporter